MVAARWYEEVVDALEGRWSAVTVGGGSVVGACMYFCSIGAIVAAVLSV